MARGRDAQGHSDQGHSNQGHDDQSYSGHSYSQDTYSVTLALARLGILPFLWIGCLVVYWWAKTAAPLKPRRVIAVFLFPASFHPYSPCRAGYHDMACTAFLAAAFLAAAVWMEQPTLRTGALFEWPPASPSSPSSPRPLLRIGRRDSLDSGITSPCA